MKKTFIGVVICTFLISISVYAITSSIQAQETYETQIISGEEIGHKNVAAKIREEVNLNKSQGFRLVNVSITTVPFGTNDYRVAYVATFERKN
ncbi:hypothetical protein [Dyadobacter psychrotolerans]|uniref:DUF1471 domain-containing protein n=1 Tax=Dyadobacter psychrotolerans TaxID=2541721 RepID=A0A4R5DU98_9BACT|nr:hypothetical protein [Dyadobacter psychrotolerans]TDE17347.1 hypothetical protein E0F88_05510 [Dyadobacter psychrotolerans]